MSQVNDERQFHDNWAKNIDLTKVKIIRAFEGTTAPENRFILNNLGSICGKKILDLGCGAGESSVYFALKGAHCVALDCSQEMLSKTSMLAHSHGVSITTVCADTIQTGFSDHSFDIVYASNLLHHTNPIKSLDEILRLVRPDGTICIWDPLIHNPIIQLYRLIATDVRTKGEKPLNMSILKEVNKRFGEVIFDTFWFASQLLFIQFFLLEHISPNKERYWKKIIYEEERLSKRYLQLERIDNFLKNTIPSIRRFAWNVAIVARKPRRLRG